MGRGGDDGMGRQGDKVRGVRGGDWVEWVEKNS